MNPSTYQPLEDQIATLGDLADAIAPYTVTPCLTIDYTGAAWEIRFPVDTRVAPAGTHHTSAHTIELAVYQALHAAKWYDAELERIYAGGAA